MIDSDTLRTAVELVNWPVKRSLGFSSYVEYEQHELDALAAELVRLVDGLNSDQIFEGSAFGSLSTGMAIVYHGTINGGDVIREDGDRTENTINAIVQFHLQNPGVLK